MSISLVKGGNLSLTKAAPDLGAITMGLGWDARTTTGVKFDLDASALGCRRGRHGCCPTSTSSSSTRRVRPRVPSSIAATTGPARAAATTRSSPIDLNAAPAALDKVVFLASIYEAETNGVTFGQVRNAFIRVVNAADQTELARYDLTEDASVETAMVFGELYRHGAEWKFRAIGQGYSSGLAGIAKDYGVNL